MSLLLADSNSVGISVAAVEKSTCRLRLIISGATRDFYVTFVDLSLAVWQGTYSPGNPSNSPRDCAPITERY